MNDMCSRGAYQTHQMTCPYCKNAQCDAEWVDVGVGLVQAGPFHCNACGATEVGPYDNRELDEVEARTGWYQPGNLPDTVSSINGTFIDADTAMSLYARGVVTQVPFQLQTSPEEFCRLLGFKLKVAA